MIPERVNPTPFFRQDHSCRFSHLPAHNSRKGWTAIGILSVHWPQIRNVGLAQRSKRDVATAMPMSNSAVGNGNSYHGTTIRESAEKKSGSFLVASSLNRTDMHVPSRLCSRNHIYIHQTSSPPPPLVTATSRK